MNDATATRTIRTGWVSLLGKLSMGVLLFETATGLAVTFGPFHAAIEWGLILHTLVGVAALAPLAWYFAWHWQDYRRQALSDVLLLGYLGAAGLLVCLLSGLVVTWEGLFAIKTSAGWRTAHLVSTLVALGAGLGHVILAWFRAKKEVVGRMPRRYLGTTVATATAGVLAAVGLSLAYSGTRYVNRFPADYNFLYGKDRPFAPSLARTSTGGAFDGRSLAGSSSCGTAGCHDQILKEWQPSAHRYAAMDTVFQTIQNVMAKQNGPESTRYCGGCHDPISLFSGTKNIFVENLTGLQGYQEGVSCLACHSIQKTDVQGNANYTISQPREYLWQWKTEGAARVARDFLIRTYPEEHNRLSKRMFKAPEYCAACHKQFIDREVNRVGWVQLQNQYDNWAASHWFKKGDARKTVECRECHMPLVDSTDPARGDTADYNRRSGDGKHRSHRFLAANNFMPGVLKVENWENHTRLTERWLRGEIGVPEIREKWAEGPIVRLGLEAPESAVAGEPIRIRVILTSNKVGHDFPTGPLDMIQSWVELVVTDEAGSEVYASGRRDADNFIEPGSFLFKAEPVDQYGNLIDRHNLWEMVGVRYRRSLFPGYSDTVEYLANCPSTIARKPKADGQEQREYQVRSPEEGGRLEVRASLMYRKVDQFLLNYVTGKKDALTAPVVEITRVARTITVRDRRALRAALPRGAELALGAAK